MPHAFLLTADEAPLYGLSAEFIDQFEDEVMDAKLQAVTDEMLGYLTTFGGAVLPLVSWGSSTRQKTADLLMYELKSWVGLATDQAAVGDDNIILRAQAARDWAKMSTLQDQEIVDSSGSEDTGSVDVESDAARGW